MTFQRDRLGSSGVFKVIVEGARKVRRALSESEAEASPEAHELGDLIAQAFVAGRYGDVHDLMAADLQRIEREHFAESWREAVAGRGPFTGFEVASVGPIELAFIPGLEEVPQQQFAAFLEIAFSSPTVPLDDDRAFVVGAVVLDRGGELRVGALHTR